MKPLQYYKKQIFIMGCLGMFPMLVFAQETYRQLMVCTGIIPEAV